MSRSSQNGISVGPAKSALGSGSLLNAAEPPLPTPNCRLPFDDTRTWEYGFPYTFSLNGSLNAPDFDVDSVNSASSVSPVAGMMRCVFPLRSVNVTPCWVVNVYE